MPERTQVFLVTARKWLRPLISLVLLGVIISRVPLDGVLSSLTHASLLLVGSAIGLFVLVSCLASYKWHLLLRAQGLDQRYRRTVSIYFVGLFFSCFLPTGFGGDAARAYLVASDTHRRADAIVSVGFDRAHSFWALLVVASPCYFYSATALNLPPEVGAALVLAVIGGSFAALFLLTMSAQFRNLPARTPLPPLLKGHLSKLVSPFEVLGEHLGVVAASSLIALASQMLGFVVQYLLFASLDVHVDVLSMVTLTSLATIATILPVSVNGIGVREGIYVILLGRIGVPPPVAVALSLLSLLTVTVNGLLGGVAFLVDRHRRPAERSVLPGRVPWKEA